MTLENAIKSAVDSRALLIIGAGFSSGIHNLFDQKMPMGNDLKNLLCNELGVEQTEISTLEDAAEIYVDSPEYGPDKLIQILEKCYTMKPHASDTISAQEIVASLPWRRVYTTNYDNVFEEASAKCLKRRTPVTPSRNVNDFIKRDLVIHINGFIDTLTPTTLMDEFKLSSKSYLLESFKKTEWFKLLQSDISSASAIIFIGVSLNYDLDLQRVIFNAPEFQNKMLFIDRELTEEDKKKKFINHKKNQFGTVENIGLSRFSDKIDFIKTSYKPSSDSKHFECFISPRNDVDTDYRTIESADLRQLLIHGIIDYNLLYFHRLDDTYLFHRIESDKLIEDLVHNNYRCFCITSSLANGKTCFVNLLAYKIQSKGIDVLFYSKENDNLQEEITKLQNVSQKTVIIIESYNLYFSLLRKLRIAIFNDNISLILTARGAIHESVQYRISDETGLGVNRICEINLDRLSNDDIPKAIALLEKADFLLNLRSVSNQFKMDLIKRTFKMQISNILLDELKSEKVRTAVSELYDGIDKIPHARDLVLASFILDVLNLKLSLNALLSLLDFGLISQELHNNHSLKQLLNISDGHIKVHSSAFAKYVLTEMGSRHIIRLLLKMNGNATKLFADSEIDALRQTLVTFSNINLLFPKKNRSLSDRKEIMEYYYKMGQTHFYDTNPFFWLQYGIASMDVPDYVRAEDILAKAYECAKTHRNNFDTFQIDTQMARFLLQSTISGHKSSAVEPFDIFCEAHKLLLKAAYSKKGSLLQVISQTSIYLDFYVSFGSQFTSGENNIVLISVRKFKEFIETYNQEQRRKENPWLIPEVYIKKLNDLERKILMSVAQENSKERKQKEA